MEWDNLCIGRCQMTRTYMLKSRVVAAFFVLTVHYKNIENVCSVGGRKRRAIPSHRDTD